MRYLIALCVLTLSSSLAEANGNVTFVSGFGNRVIVSQDVTPNLNFLALDVPPVFIAPRVTFAAPLFVGPRVVFRAGPRVVFRGVRVRR